MGRSFSTHFCNMGIQKQMKRLAGVAPLIAILLGCNQEARVYPLDPAAMQAGVPKIEFLRQMAPHGPVTVTMPDGEILRGEYQVAQNAAVGVGFAGGQTFTAVGFGGGQPLVVSATGEHTIMNCNGTADIGGHGFAVCETSKGKKYRVMF